MRERRLLFQSSELLGFADVPPILCTFLVKATVISILAIRV